LAVLAVVVVQGVRADAGQAARECASVAIPEIRGTDLQTFGGLGCDAARRLLRRYFTRVVDEGQLDGGCAQLRFADGCEIGDFVCFQRLRTPAGRCTDGGRVVRFREYDRGPD
jgi:hypothetical protein